MPSLLWCDRPHATTPSPACMCEGCVLPWVGGLYAAGNADVPPVTTLPSARPWLPRQTATNQIGWGGGLTLRGDLHTCPRSSCYTVGLSTNTSSFCQTKSRCGPWLPRHTTPNQMGWEDGL